MGYAISKITNNVLLSIKPDETERKNEISFANWVIKKLKRITRARVVLTGSVAKGTFLKDTADLDIFVLFPRSIEKIQFKEKIETIVKKAFPHEKQVLSYAEHPYVRLFINGKRIDVVPAYAITASSELGSAVDRSVLHTKFILQSVSKKQRDDVLLLKKFLRSAELYGAEIKVQGFSGYLCELLILRYGNFARAMRSMTKYKLPIFIDIRRFYKSKEEKIQAVRRFSSELIVIDPTDKNRNVAAAVSIGSLKQCIRIAGLFIKRPSVRFFGVPKTFQEKIKQLKNSYLISIKKPQIVDDVLWGQIRKLERLLIGFLKRHDFQVRKIVIDAEKNIQIVITFKENELADKKLLIGPGLKLKHNVTQFKKAHPHSKFIIKNRRVCAFVTREIQMIDEALKVFFKKTELPSHLNKKTVKISKNDY